jgi:serine protease Do
LAKGKEVFMKKVVSVLIAAAIGSSMTIGAYELAIKENKKTVKIEYIENPPARQVVYQADGKDHFVPLDFTVPAEKVMPSVVHIKSTQRTVGRDQRQEFRDPFRDFFGDDWFRDFFGPRFRYESPERRPYERASTGSGVIISEDGYIVTNYHVIANADEIEVTLHDNRAYIASVVGTDPTTDLALIQIRENKLTPVPIANSDQVKVGEWVLAVGNPFNLNSTVTAGIVSAKARSINILDAEYAVESFIQTDAAINPGNSGGALVNMDGGLIGVNTAIASPTGAYAGYGFAVPSNIVKKVLEDLIKFGNVQRGYLGVTIRGVTGRLAEEKDLAVIKGVYVDSVLENSSAHRAGIKPGDVIMAVNGREVRNPSHLQELIARHRPGDKVAITVNRKGKERDFEILLRDRDGSDTVVARNEREILNILGAEFETIERETAKKLNIPGGVKINKLYPGPLRRDTNIRENFIIIKVNGQPVSSVKELAEILENKSGGVMLEGVYEDRPGTYYYAFGLTA